MNDVKKPERIEYIDIARGIGIILMIAGHVYYDTVFRDIIFSFHMPLFLFISGMLYKYNENTKEFIIKIIKRLYIPYVIGVVFVSTFRNILLNSNIKILPQILVGFSNCRSMFPTVETVGALWFIPYLIFIQIVYNYINKVAEGKDVLLLYETIVLMLCGFYFKKEQVYLPWSIDVALTTMIFYFIGNMLQKHKLMPKIMNNNWLIVALCIIWLVGAKFTYLEFAHRKYSIVTFIVAFCGCVVTIKLSDLINKYLKIIGRVLIWFGKNSIYILIFHYFEYKIFVYSGSMNRIMLEKMIFVVAMTLLLNAMMYMFRKISTKVTSKN